MYDIDKLRRQIIDTFADHVVERPADGGYRVGGEIWPASRLMAFEPAWTLSDEQITDNIYGLDEVTGAGFEFVLGRLLLFCVDHPNCPTSEIIARYISDSEPYHGRFPEFGIVIGRRWASLLFRVFSMLERQSIDAEAEQLFRKARLSACQIYEYARQKRGSRARE